MQRQYLKACAEVRSPSRKVCFDCGLEKSSADFNPGHNKRDGLRPYCKMCWAIRNKEQQQTHIEKYQARAAQWYEDHKDLCNAKSRRWYEKNKARHLENARKWAELHRDAKRAIERRHAHNRRSNGGVGLTIAQVHELQHSSCHYCGVVENIVNGVKRSMEIDHIVPVSKGGRTELSNVTSACRRCNAKKHDLLPNEFATRYPAPAECSIRCEVDAYLATSVPKI